jgi:multidrug efflux system outer membrane protein
MKLSVLPLTVIVTGSAFAGLSVGPDYQRPDATAPSAYADVDTSLAGRSAIIPSDWWRTFNDPGLDALQSQALAANQELRASLARVEQARALAGLARSDYLPSLSVQGDVVREEHSRTVSNALPVGRTTTYQVPLSLSWELDLFGRVRRLNESARAELAAAGATWDAARLALTAEVASTHFTLRALDRERAVVDETIQVRRDALQLVRARFDRGGVGELDLARAETELAATEADLAALLIRRAQTQTALAVLLGEPAPGFTAPVSASSESSVPAIPAGLPSELLTRRPDIAAAERTLAAGSARIGVAKAAFFPSLSLTGGGGYASGEVDGLFRTDSRFWSIGPSLYLPLFQGGRNRANLARSKAAYEELLANYRQQVLVAFREVQDALTASKLLTEQASAQARAVASARRGAELSRKRYDAGFVSYLEVVDAQRTALEVERADARLSGQRWITHIALIKALGGGWQDSGTERPRQTVAQVR